MPYNQHLAECIALELNRKRIAYEEKKMFGGSAFMVDDKICIGVMQDNLMARINPAEMAELLQRPGATPMDFNGRNMKGFLYITDVGWDADADLSFWVDKCLEYNPLAKSSKK
jgi:TfoX/Sxy family transcriptional regulator of competence genes